MCYFSGALFRNSSGFYLVIHNDMVHVNIDKDYMFKGIFILSVHNPSLPKNEDKFRLMDRFLKTTLTQSTTVTVNVVNLDLVVQR